MKRLEHEADLLVSESRTLGRGEAGDLLPLERVAAARRLVEKAEDVHERGLAGTGRSGDGHELAARDGQRDVRERVDRAAVRRRVRLPICSSSITTNPVVEC